MGQPPPQGLLRGTRAESDHGEPPRVLLLQSLQDGHGGAGLVWEYSMEGHGSVPPFVIRKGLCSASSQGETDPQAGSYYAAHC